MAAELYPPILKATLVYEGGFAHHPADPGGATMKGVTQRVYDAYRKAEGKPTQSVRGISDLELQAIYREQYWNAIHGDQLPAGVDFAVFDGAVMSGPGQSSKWLQRALLDLGLYAGPIDGKIGLSTLRAVSLVRDNDDLVAKVCARRLAFCKQLRIWPTFGIGWASRIANVKKKGQAWATGGVGPEPVYLAGMEVKAQIEDAKPMPAKSVAATAGGAGVGTAGSSVGLSFYLDQAKEQLGQVAGVIPSIQMVLAYITLAGVLVAVGGFGWRQWQAYQAKRAADRLDLPSGVTA